MSGRRGFISIILAAVLVKIGIVQTPYGFVVAALCKTEMERWIEMGQECHADVLERHYPVGMDHKIIRPDAAAE